MCDGDKERLSLAEEEEKNARGILGKNCPLSLHLRPLRPRPSSHPPPPPLTLRGQPHHRGQKHAHFCALFLQPSLFYPFISEAQVQKTDGRYGPLLPSCGRARNCTSEARTQSGFPGIRWARAVVAKQDIHHHQACPLPSQRPQLMNHQRVFHGVLFILIKQSRLLFLRARSLPARETNGGCQKCSSRRSRSLLGGWIQGAAGGNGSDLWAGLSGDLRSGERVAFPPNYT